MGVVADSSPGEVVASRSDRRQLVLPLAIVGVVFVIAYISIVHTRQLFAPDTRYYASMAMVFGGTAKATAQATVAHLTATLGYVTPPVKTLFGWGLVQPRVVYPGLSVPFVKLFGIRGMAVVPAIAMFAFSMVTAVILVRRFGAAAAVAALVLLLASPQLVFYGSAMLTESLSALWVALTVFAAWSYTRNPRWRPLAAMVAFTVLLSFTRQSTLIPAGAFVAAWVGAVLMRRRPNPFRWPALAVAATSIAVQLLQMVVWPGFSQIQQFELKTGTHTLAQALAAAPRLAWHIFKGDTEYMMKADQALLILLTLSVASMLVLFRRAESHMLFGALAATTIYDVTNGTPAVFRYGMPALIFVAMSVAALVERVTIGLSPRRAQAEPESRFGNAPVPSGSAP